LTPRTLQSVSPPVDADVAAHIESILRGAGLGAGPISIRPGPRSGNNRIYEVCAGAQVFAVKQYFRHPDDGRDRLMAETAFLQYAGQTAPGIAPALFGLDRQAGLALMEFIEGAPLLPHDITGTHVDAAIDFFRRLNQLPARSSGLLPLASEARFSINGHLTLIDERVNRLLQPDVTAAGDRRRIELCRSLAGLWRDVAGNVRQAAAREGFALDDEIRHPCVSPSDFGFHNAIATGGGAVRFVDFEYAGLDDPAKTAGDFFAQLAVPVPPKFFDRFVDGCLAVLPDGASSVARARLLRPAYQIKWCCIALNILLPTHLARRRFANPAFDADAMTRVQMDKAEHLMQSIPTRSQ